MAEPQISLDGPYDDSGTSYGLETELYLVDSARNSTDTETNLTTLPGKDSGEAIQAPLKGSRDFSYEGTTNVTRLQQAGYSGSRTSVFQQRLFEIESLVQPGQGAGYILTDKQRNETIDPNQDLAGVLVDECSWEYSFGEGLKSEWRVTAQYAEGVQPPTNRQTYINNQIESQTSIAETEVRFNGLGIEVGSVDSLRVERSINLDMNDLLHQQDSEVVGVFDEGVTMEITVEGMISGRDADLDWMATLIDKEIHGEQAVLRDEVTAREMNCTAADTSTTFKAGEPDKLEYNITLERGEVVTE